MKRITALLIFLLTVPLAFSSPGAHGPNGEHLDAPNGNVQGDAAPRIDTFTESFELVGRLHEGELSILIDRYETNEPVLHGKLEVESNGLKAAARFHADHGDYAIDDERFLNAISKPGKHPLIFTLTAGEESDLLEGILDVRAESGAEDHGHFPWKWAVAALTAGALLIFVAAHLRRRKNTAGKRHV